ncbi:Protein kinase domain [Macleaya cordata]|uniref:Protein kinase domain n=1 Tax=Macleaya cordata TaxID=56857 RepID=A0A200PP91_MACCD|nr:Protein kinase domain [Macleaya cordata]
MGCFTVMKSKKKKSELINIHAKPISPQQSTPTVLPEPQNQSLSLQSAPPSFRDRVKPVPSINRVSSSRTRALSAPSSLNMAEQDTLLSGEYDEQEESKSRGGLIKEHLGPSPQPLPLPAPQSAAMLKTGGSFKAGNANGPILVAPGPLPLPPLAGLRNFSYEEIAAACHQFSPDRCMSECLSSVIYKASFGDDSSGSKKLEATVTRLLPSSQGFKEFFSEVSMIASLQHPQLCKLLGYHAREGFEPRMLVYERLFHGSLDLLLYGRSDGPPIDWNSRMKVALCAAQGLTFLHEEGPFQAMYNEFSTANIQIDKDFSAKLSGYGCVSQNPEILDTSPAVANLSVETLERGLLTPKSNVWSFGIVLLELLTGRKNLYNRHPKEERDLVKWSRPYLTDDCRLSLIMDPRLKGRFPPKAARTVADIALRCLQKDSLERPTMRTIVESLQNIQDMKHSCRFPLQEPATIAGKNMSRSPSLNGIVTRAPRLSFPPSPPLRTLSSLSLTRQPSMPMLRPRASCSSIVSVEENVKQEIRKSRSSTARRVAGVEGF